jgi:hypothetical protein
VIADLLKTKNLDKYLQITNSKGRSHIDILCLIGLLVMLFKSYCLIAKIFIIILLILYSI